MTPMTSGANSVLMAYGTQKEPVSILKRLRMITGNKASALRQLTLPRGASPQSGSLNNFSFALGEI
jgi:hypothetical protein